MGGVVVYAQRRPELVHWARYIDNILPLWDRDQESLHDFISDLNVSDKGIALSYEARREKIHFLDLEISIVNQQFEIKTYFKPTVTGLYL